jgi:uncharacterized membrane protein YeaQ/YmgE (transglycosylase-associated protein family)
MINFLVWLILGAIVGWLASVIMHTDGEQGTFIDIVVGVVGSFLAGFFLTPLFGISTINEGNFSVPGFIVSLLGSMLLLAIVKFFRRDTMVHHH